MAVNKRKILETARKLAQKGAKDKALKEYAKLLKLDPKDAKLRLEIGDAHRRWGQVDEAIDTYKRVAEQYMAEGFDARSVAVYKQIVNLNPDCLDAYAPLAELYERMGLAAEAILALQTAADGYHRQGNKTEALSLLRRMANADSTNTTSRIKVADLLRQEEMNEESLAEYALAAEELERQGDTETISSVYRRMLELDEKHVGALSALAKNLSSRGKLTESIPLAERALELDASTPEQYEMLAGLYEQAGRAEDRAGVYRKLSDLYRERGDEDTARGIMQRYVPSEALSVPGLESDSDPPPHPAARDQGDLFGDGFDAGEGGDETSLDFGNERLDTAQVGEGEVLELVDDIPVESSESEAEDDAISLDQPLVEVVSTPVEAAVPSAAEPVRELPESVDVEQLLAEASVYLRYGKRDRAVAHLERVLESEPEHLTALDKLGEVFAEAGESERAVEVWLRAAKRANDEGNESALETLKGRIGALDPAAASRLGSAAPEQTPEPAGVELDLGGLDDDLTLDDSDDELLEDELLEDELSVPALEVEAAPEPEEAEVEEALVDPMGASISAVSSAQVQEDLEEAEFYMEQELYDEAERIYQRVLSVAPSHPKALLRLGEMAAARGADPTPEPPPTPTLVEAPLSLGDDLLTEDLSLEDDVSVPDLRPAMAFDEAEDLDHLADLDLDLEPAEEALEPETEVAAEPEPDGSDTEEFEVSAVEEAGEFDLAAALSEAFDDVDDPGASQSGRQGEDDGFNAVFDAFKKGVSETLGEGDHQAHYDLAIAYKEMGLHDDAIAELEIAMSDGGRQAECLHLMALCAFDADRAPLAVEHLEKLLAVPDLAGDAALAARFDLGRALASVGDPEAAREMWSRVAEERPGFQDVEGRLAELDLPEPEAEPEPEDEEAGSGFESFEDMMEGVLDDDQAAEPEPEPEAEPVLEPEPQPPEDSPAPTSDRKRRKKISFV